MWGKIGEKREQTFTAKIKERGGIVGRFKAPEEILMRTNGPALQAPGLPILADTHDSRT